MGTKRALFRAEAADDAAMRALGADLAGRLMRDWSNDRILVVRLEGPLGAGKTTFVRGFLRALGHEGAVRSPTYTLIEPYVLPFRDEVLRIAHLDLYRLADPEELEFIGLRDLLSEPGILLVEWPDRGGEILPRHGVRARIEYRGAGRAVEIVPQTSDASPDRDFASCSSIT